MSLRDPEFAETLDGFYHTSQLVVEPHLPIHKVWYFSASSGVVADVFQRLRVAFMQ